MGIVKSCNYSINKNDSGKAEAARRLIELTSKGNLENAHVCDYSNSFDQDSSIFDYLLEVDEKINKELTLTKVSSVHGD